MLQENVNCTMDKCVLSKSSNAGLHVMQNYTEPVTVTGCEFSQACYFGAKAVASKTVVHLVDCSMKDNRQYGAGGLAMSCKRYAPHSTKSLY